MGFKSWEQFSRDLKARYARVGQKLRVGHLRQLWNNDSAQDISETATYIRRRC